MNNNSSGGIKFESYTLTKISLSLEILTLTILGFLILIIRLLNHRSCHPFVASNWA